MEKDLQAIERETEREEIEEKKSSFRSFYQINLTQRQGSKFTQLIAKEPMAAAILNFMFELMDKTNALIASQQVFMNRFDISRATVSRAIKILRDGGFIYVYKSGTSNVYVVNPDLAWKTYGKNRRFCEFPATVVLDYDEQELTETRKNYKSRMNRNVIALNDEEGNGVDIETGEAIQDTRDLVI